MKKGLVITFTVALLGIIGFYNSKHTSSSARTITPPSNSSSTQKSSSSTSFKDGTYNGDAAETPYGTVQIAVTVSGGKISDVNFLQMPNDQGHSREVTAMSEPLLKQMTLQAQSSHIDFVSGATSTAYGYQESLQAALDKAAGSAFVTPSQTNSV